MTPPLCQHWQRHLKAVGRQRKDHAGEQHTVNMGFIRTMNRAMAMSPDKDVVWLNADTRVTR